jgi:hypothetical protein
MWCLQFLMTFLLSTASVIGTRSTSEAVSTKPVTVLLAIPEGAIEGTGARRLDRFSEVLFDQSNEIMIFDRALSSSEIAALAGGRALCR